MTPEDLTAIGIKKPHDREKIKQHIDALQLPDSLPNYVPVSTHAIEIFLSAFTFESIICTFLSVCLSVRLSVQKLTRQYSTEVSIECKDFKKSTCQI